MKVFYKIIEIIKHVQNEEMEKTVQIYDQNIWKSAQKQMIFFPCTSFQSRNVDYTDNMFFTICLH
jgi:hypothetical protein